MTVKAINHVKYADPVTDPATDASAATPVIDPQQEDRANGLIKDLKSALKELDQTSTYYEYLSLEEQAKIETMKARIEGEIALLETFLETGEWPGVGGEYMGSWYSELPELDAGWHSSNSEHKVMDHGNSEFSEYEAQMTSDEGTLVDVVEIPMGSYNVDMDTLEGSALGLVVTDDRPVDRITGKTVGEDIWITVEYADGGVETTILKGLATRQDVLIYISAEQCTTDIIMDFSKAFRVGVETNGQLNPNTNGFILVGGKGNDTIIGSQNNDKILGWEGDDKLLGMGGSDTIFGDGAYKTDVNDYLHSINDSTGGRDFIDGGEGFDAVYGGGSMDTVVNDVNSPSGTETPQEWEDTISLKDKVNWADYNESEMFSLTGWTPTKNENTGEIVLNKTSDMANDKVVINTPDGYTMAYAVDDGSDIVVTFVKLEEDGEESYMRVRIKGALATGNQTEIEVVAGSESTILDFSKLMSGSNIIKLTGKNGNDALLGPITNLDELGIDATAIDGPSTLVLQAILDTNQAGNEDGIIDWGGHTWADAKVSGDHIELLPESGSSNLNLEFHVDGFTPQAVYYKTEGNDLWIYAIQKQPDGSFDLLKIKIVGGAQNGVVNSASVSGTPMIPMGCTYFEGSGGDDLIVGSTASTTSWGGGSGNDKVIQGFYQEGLEVNTADAGLDFDDFAITDDKGFVYGSDGMPTGWNADPDGDKFTNKEEIDAGSDPSDPDSTPNNVTPTGGA